MSLGERLYELRKKKGLSQEEVAEKLNVTRQSVSKWETDESKPDFDKIVPICELYGISSNELLTGEKEEKENSSSMSEEEKAHKRIGGIAFSIFLYFVAVAWIMTSVAALNFDPVISSAIFLLICGVATCIIIYSCVFYKKKKTEEEKNPILKKVDDIVSIITLVVYLVVSFLTMAWHITWIIWIIYALVMEIIKLIFMLKENENEK
jgi:transcriptional regulator with XRE-family HTH domain